MKWKYLIVLMLMAGSALADHNAVQLDKLILGLPDGWVVSIIRPQNTDTCGNKALFEMTFTMPAVEYEIGMKGRKEPVTVHPSLALMFYAPFSPEKDADFQKKADAITHSARAVAAPYVFAKTENYWVLTYGGGNHPKVTELGAYLKAALSVNRKE